MSTVRITRTALGQYVATNEAGTELGFGEGEDQFSSVELLLAALGGCTGIDVDHLTSRRSEPSRFEITVEADKVSDPTTGNHLGNVTVTFSDLSRAPKVTGGEMASARHWSCSSRTR